MSYDSGMLNNNQVLPIVITGIAYTFIFPPDFEYGNKSFTQNAEIERFLPIEDARLEATVRF